MGVPASSQFGMIGVHTMLFRGVPEIGIGRWREEERKREKVEGSSKPSLTLSERDKGEGSRAYS